MTEEFLKYIQIQTLCKVPFIDVAGIDFERGEGAKIECKPIQITEIILNMLKGFQKSCSVSELESKLYRLQQKKTLYPNQIYPRIKLSSERNKSKQN